MRAGKEKENSFVRVLDSSFREGYVVHGDSYGPQRIGVLRQEIVAWQVDTDFGDGYVKLIMWLRSGGVFEMAVPRYVIE